MQACVRVGRYADCEDGTDFSGSERRYFRNSLKITERAVDCWNANALVKTAQHICAKIDGR